MVRVFNIVQFFKYSLYIKNNSKKQYFYQLIKKMLYILGLYHMLFTLYKVENVKCIYYIIKIIANFIRVHCEILFKIQLEYFSVYIKL